MHCDFLDREVVGMSGDNWYGVAVARLAKVYSYNEESQWIKNSEIYLINDVSHVARDPF